MSNPDEYGNEEHTRMHDGDGRMENLIKYSFFGLNSKEAEQGQQRKQSSTTNPMPSIFDRIKRHMVWVSLVLSVVALGMAASILVDRSHRPGPLEQAKGGMCLMCTRLEEKIDRWAWPEGIEDRGTGECCLSDHFEIAEMITYYVDNRFSRLHEDVERLEQKLDRLDSVVWDLIAIGNTSVSGRRSQDILRLVELIQKMFHKERAVLHLTSQQTVNDEEPKVVWNSDMSQGSLSLNGDGKSVNITSTGLYFISTHIKFRSIVPQNQTRNTTVQFYLASWKEGRLGQVDDYKKCFVFHRMMAEHDAVLHTVTRLERGENLIIRFPTSQKNYLATDHGSHRLSIFELS